MCLTDGNQVDKVHVAPEEGGPAGRSDQLRPVLNREDHDAHLWWLRVQNLGLRVQDVGITEMGLGFIGWG